MDNHVTSSVEQQLLGEEVEVVDIIVNKQIGDSIVQEPRKMILYSTYEKAIRESQSKDVIVEAVREKAEYLQKLIALSTNQIEELCAQLAKN